MIFSYWRYELVWNPKTFMRIHYPDPKFFRLTSPAEILFRDLRELCSPFVDCIRKNVYLFQISLGFLGII